MKALMLIQFVFICGSVMAKNADTVYVTLDIEKYNLVARQELVQRFSTKDSVRTGPMHSLVLSNRYNLGEFQILSIPVFGLNQRATDYKCGDNVELLIDFKEDPYFQMVSVTEKRRDIGGFIILDSFNESMRIKDSINGDNIYHLHSNPIYYDNRKTEREIAKYKGKNAGAFVFMIKYIEGFWVIRQGNLYKLVGTKERSANRYFIKHYGKDYVRDASSDELRTGYPYWSCDVLRYKFQPVFIKIKK